MVLSVSLSIPSFVVWDDSPSLRESPLILLFNKIFLLPIKKKKSAKNNGLFKGFQVGSDKVNVSHLQLANDTLILMEGEENNVLVHKSLTRHFELVSGFKVNWLRSHLWGLGLTNSECSHMASLFCCSNKGWQNEYLSSPLGGPPRNKDFWDQFVDRCRKRLTRWKANWAERYT